MFTKKEPIKEGASIPFLEQTEETFSLAYNELEVKVTDDSVKIVFIQSDTPVYAYTYKKDYGDINCSLKGMKGVVELRLI